jgi:signal transduction histidine kinase
MGGRQGDHSNEIMESFNHAKAKAFGTLGLRRRDVFLFCFAFGALFAIGTAVLGEHNEISRSHDRVSAALLASQSAENIAALLLKAETAQRGFLITGSATYLQPYFAVVHEMPAALKDFDRAIQNIHLETEKGRAVVGLVAAKFDEMSGTIDLYRKFGADRAIEPVRTNLGKRLMDQFVVRNNEIKRECVYVLTRESDQLRDRNQMVLYITIIGFPAVLLTLVLTALRLRTLFRRKLELIAENQSSSEQYRLLAGHLDSVREEERGHLAREIHDVLGQALTVTKLQVAMARRHIMAADTDVTVAKLDGALTSLDTTIKMLRQVANELRPPLLDSVGLQAALEAYTREVQERTQLKIHFESSDDLPRLTATQNITAYRICQESLTNVVRHAHAEEVSVSLLLLGDAVTLTVKDNGIGLPDPAVESRRSFGLLGMQERAQLIDGELAISSGSGTTVTLQFPIDMSAK